MAKLTVKAGSTSRIEHIFLLDSTSTTGAGKTGVTTTGTTAYYIRNGQSTPTAITLDGTGTVGTYVSGDFLQVDSANMPGVYELHVPDAVFASATGVNHAVVMIKGTGFAPVVLEYDLVAYDPTDTVRLGLTALPNVAAGANGGLPTGNASGQVTVASLVTAANEAVADAVLSRDIATSNVEDTATQYTLCSVILGMLENEIVGTTLTIFKSDHSTTHVTKSLTTTAASSANVITEID